jgi:hypothetical protein
MSGKRLLFLAAAVPLAIFFACSAFPYIDPRVPFRFEPFTGPLWIIGIGPLNLEGANKTFLKHFPVGTPASRVEEYFRKVGGHCFTLPIVQPGRLMCDYGHLKFPWICIAQVWNATMTIDPVTNRIATVEVHPWVDGC